MVNMARTVFFADILGFGALAGVPGAKGAKDALSDVAHLLSTEDELVQFLGRSVWTERYGLSDSIFLVSESPVEACAAAAEFFFNLAYVDRESPNPVFLRGALTIGEAYRVGPIFPESAKANLVGEAVVRAVRLEETGAKGPHLLLAPEAAQAWEESTQPKHWLLDRTPEGHPELLWLLPPDPAFANGLLIGEVCRAALGLIREHGANPRFGYHYIGYLDLVTRSLQRLREKSPQEGAIALKGSGLHEQASDIEQTLLARLSLEESLRARLQDLIG